MTKLNRRDLLTGTAALGAGLAFGTSAGTAQATDVVFLSTQLRPIEEAQKVRQVILRGFGTPVQYVTEEPPQLNVRMRAEAAATRRTVSVVGALHGELQPLAGMGAVAPIDDLARRLAGRGIPAALMELGKLGTPNQQYIPWMQATYIMVAHRQALPFLPAGADINALTYDQLGQWAGNIRERTGQRRLGFPAGPRGLMPRFFQGYFYPSYTGSAVTGFRSAEAESAWTAFRALWANVNPNATNYNFMQEQLLGGEVWIAFDHVARVLDALRTSPDQFVAFPAPAGPKGRGYMPVVAGLSIANNAPNRAAAEALIEHLTTPATQLVTAAEVGFFPVVNAELPANLNAGVRLAADAIARTQSARDALVSLLPVGLGDKGGEFNKVYMDTFQRIVLRNENIRTVLDAEANNLRTIMRDTGAPCWSPDPPSQGACPVT
jgi:multiple sugar transport system substrate-binding protein